MRAENGKVAMHAQVVTYRLVGLSDAEFIEANREFAEMMAAVPGLIAKIWLKGPVEEGYGGIYLWEDRDACDAFLAGELWSAAEADVSMLDLESRDFAVMDELTRSTQPGLQMV